MNTLNESNFLKIIKSNFLKKSCSYDSIGDDCTILPINNNESYTISTDTCSEGFHFRIKNTNIKSLARKIVASSISDIISMGSVPKFLLISISIPKYIQQNYIRELYKYIYKELNYLNIKIIGGDSIMNTPYLSITTTSIGKVKNSKITYRHTHTENDYIYVTGTIGNSGYGLKILENDTHITQIYKKERNYLVKCHNNPPIRLNEFQYLINNYNITSCTDTSDSIIKSIKNMLTGTSHSAIIKSSDIPISSELSTILKTKSPLGIDYKSILDLGEDYEMLFSSPDKINSDDLKKYSISLIGNITKNTSNNINKISII